jgi:hypothetical protein
MKKGQVFSKKSVERIDLELTEEELSASLPGPIKLTCKVVGDKPPIIWDDSQSVWLNLLANLGFLHEDQYSIVGDGNKELSSVVKDRLKVYIKKTKSLHPDQTEEIRKIPMSLSAEGLRRLNSLSGGLPGQVEKMLGTLHNHRRDGSPDHLCAILQYAVQKSTDIRLGEKQKAIKDRVELPAQLENSQIEALKLLNAKHEVMIKSLKSERQRQPGKLDSKKPGVDQKIIAELEADNARLEALLQSPNPGALPKQKEVPVEDASWVNWAANRYNKAKVSAVKLVEYADSLLQAPVDTEALQYIGTHSDDLVQKSQLIIQTKHEFKSMTLNLEILEKKIALEKDKKKKLTADVDKLDQLQFELSLIKVPSTSQPEKPTIEMVVTVDRGKKIGWVEDSGLCENVQRLLEEYLSSDRYRTRDRLKSAKAVIDKISGLAEKSPLERDKALLDFIRLEQPKISSHGFNGKSSRLYGIYQQAEIHMRRRIDAEFAGINELNHENEETKKSLDTSIQSVDRLKLRMDKFKAILQAAASMSGEAEFVGGSFKERANLPDNRHIVIYNKKIMF